MLKQGLGEWRWDRMAGAPGSGRQAATSLDARERGDRRKYRPKVRLFSACIEGAALPPRAQAILAGSATR